MANQIDREALVTELMHAAIYYANERAGIDWSNDHAAEQPGIQKLIALENDLEKKVRALVCGRALEQVTH